MYNPPAFAVTDIADIHAMMRSYPLANLVTVTADGPLATPLPMFLREEEGEYGTLYAHMARANPQWSQEPIGNGLAIFMGIDAYVSPSWYASKQEHGKVVPTWNYTSVQVRGPVEFFDDTARLLDVVTRLTALHEGSRREPWQVSDAPEAFIAAQLRGIVGLRMPIHSLSGKRKMSQNRSEADRRGVRAGLAGEATERHHIMAGYVPE